MDPQILKTRIENLNLTARTMNALSSANIRTIGGLARKKEKDILEVEGLRETKYKSKELETPVLL